VAVGLAAGVTSTVGAAVAVASGVGVAAASGVAVGDASCAATLTPSMLSARSAAANIANIFRIPFTSNRSKIDCNARGFLARTAPVRRLIFKHSFEKRRPKSLLTLYLRERRQLTLYFAGRRSL
jgi:hypothetical protein